MPGRELGAGVVISGGGSAMPEDAETPSPSEKSAKPGDDDRLSCMSMDAEDDDAEEEVDVCA